IQKAIKDLAGTHVANIIPNYEANSKLGTIHGISSWHKWAWPDEGEEVRYILAKSLPELGPWKKYASEQIIKITKDHIFKRPELLLLEHTIPPKSWTMLALYIQNKNIMNKLNTKYQNNFGKILLANIAY
ncbi:15639_t:CDS:2, partial [Dentiscutata erythropus]